jgi:hypothetical protein
MESVEKESEKSSLNILDHMTVILRDIKPEKIGPIYKRPNRLNYTWETICIVARTASLETLWHVPTKPFEEYLTEINKENLENFYVKWTQTKKNPNTNALDFLALLNHSNV